MFVIINVKASGRKKIKRGKTVDRVFEQTTENGERFYIIDALDSEKGVNWDEVSYFVGGNRRSVLLDRSYALPEFSKLKRFEPYEFSNILLFNTVNIIFRELYLSGCRIKCFIIDKNGDFPHLAEKAVRYASETTIVTDNKFKYLNEAAWLYDYYGASLTVSDCASADDGAIVIDTGKTSGYSGKGVLFSLDRGFSPLEPDGFYFLKSKCPPYIDIRDFFGAALEYNKETSLLDASCGTLLSNGSPVTAAQAAESVKKILSRFAEAKKSVTFYV